MRMLSPDVDPGIKAFIAVVRAAEHQSEKAADLMGQKFFDIHESSRFNMSFKCSGEFNIIYIMRTNLVEAQC